MFKTRLTVDNGVVQRRTVGLPSGRSTPAVVSRQSQEGFLSASLVGNLSAPSQSSATGGTPSSAGHPRGVQQRQSDIAKPPRGSLAAAAAKSLKASAAVSGGLNSGTPLTANFATPMSIGSFGGVQFNTMFRGILPDNAADDSQLGTMLRDIWHYDNVGGSAVDLQCGLAFSDWTLSGVPTEIAATYNDCMARLNMRVMLPQISRNYLVDGAFLGSLLYEPKTRTFQDVLIHDRFNATISPQPFFSMDPTVVVNSASNLQQFFSAYSPYAEEALKGYPRRILENFMQGSNVLDPVTTLMVLRKGTADSSAVSYLRRLLPMYLLEKTLFRGTITEATKRQRATTQIMMGDDTWEPTDQELFDYTQKFQMADMDPLGAWVATRQGVTLTDVRPAGEIWKWTDSADVLVPYKLRALGLSEAFMSSDSTFANAEASLTMFMDNLDTYREYLTYRTFYAKLFPLIAVLNNFYRNTKEVQNPNKLSNLLFNMGNQKNLMIPKIQWHKKLESPNASSLLDNLAKLEEKGFPVALKTWAAAANVDLASAISDHEDDQNLRAKLDEIRKTSGNPQDGGPPPSQDSEFSEDAAYSEYANRVRAAMRNSEVKPLSVAGFNDKGPGLLSREFGGDFKFSKTGKPLPASRGESKNAHNNLEKAIKSLADPHRREEVKKNIVSRLGGVPRVTW